LTHDLASGWLRLVSGVLRLQDMVYSERNVSDAFPRCGSGSNLLAVELPIDVRDFGIGDLAIDLGDDVAVLEPGHMGVAEKDVAAPIVPSGKTIAPVVGATEVGRAGAAIGVSAGCMRCSKKATKANGCAAQKTLNGVSGTLLGAGTLQLMRWFMP